MSIKSNFNVMESLKKVNLVAEISGAFGDMGTLIPILVSLSITGQISLSASLCFGGLWNIISGFYFGIPMVVQPMKSIAAIALLAHLDGGSIAAAGLTVSFALIFFSLTGLMALFNKYIPIYIIRGIQLGTGLTLISKGITSVLASKQWLFTGYAWSDNYLIAAISFVVVFAFWRARWSASALALFIVGMIISSTKVDLSQFTIGPSFVAPFVPTASQWWKGFNQAGLGQLPLTISNSVIAVSALAMDLFPERNGHRTDVTTVSLWVAAMNLIGAWFGSIPYCCGSGGLAAQYRFGARTGISIIILGFIKIFSGLLFGNSLLLLFKAIPNSIIGVLLMVAGLQISMITINLGSYANLSKREDAYLCMILTAICIVGFANDGIGFLIGCSAAAILEVSSLNEVPLESPKIVTDETTVTVPEVVNQ